MKTSEMTEDQIRVRCADLEGWKQWQNETGKGLSWTPPGKEYAIFMRAEPPDYCNSIDAINAVVKRLPLKSQAKWAFALIDILESVTPEPEFGKTETILLLVTASALDRARAFVAIHE